MNREDASPDGGAAVFDRIRDIADAVLYEGYLLYPYRKSSPKNRVRWQFGIVAPRAWVERDGAVAPSVAGSVESWRQQTECLAEPTRELERVEVCVRIRFLQVESKTVERCTPGGHVPVDSLEVDGVGHLSFDEAVPHERDVAVALPDLLDAARSIPIGAPGGETIESLGDAGRVVRRREPVSATATLRTERLETARQAYRVRLVIENTSSEAGPDSPRAEALRYSLIGTHVMIGGQGLDFVSLIEPPRWAEPDAGACRNIHTFPVLAGLDGSRSGMLSSPILLYDYPRVAPESPGDLHDAAEIDEILSLRTLTLTEDEKREARATDPRAAEIIDRVADIPAEVLARLHGAVRSPSLDPTTEPNDAET